MMLIRNILPKRQSIEIIHSVVFTLNFLKFYTRCMQIWLLHTMLFRRFTLNPLFENFNEEVVNLEKTLDRKNNHKKLIDWCMQIFFQQTSCRENNRTYSIFRRWNIVLAYFRKISFAIRNKIPYVSRRLFYI